MLFGSEGSVARECYAQNVIVRAEDVGSGRSI